MFHVRIKVTSFKHNLCDSFCTLNSIWLDFITCSLRLETSLTQFAIVTLKLIVLS